MDLDLSSIQSLIESIAYRTNADVALVLTKQGLVVAHSNISLMKETINSLTTLLAELENDLVTL